MTVYVVGNCQATALATCLAAMHPTLRVEVCSWTVDACAFAASGDLVVRQRHPAVPWMMGDVRPNEILFPPLWFNGFHPDAVDVSGPEGPVPSPLGFLHSSLAFTGWTRGLGVDETLALFRAQVFDALAFGDAWHVAQRKLLEDAAAAGLVLDELFTQWRGRCFMHTPNHAKLGVTAEIARAVSRKAGLRAAVTRPEDHLVDAFLDGPIWPVYPAIAARLHVPGEYAFVRPRSEDGSRESRVLDLPEFVARSYAIYENYAAADLTCERVQAARYRDLAVRREPARAAAAPYAGLAPYHFWRTAVADVAREDVDPGSPPPFTIDRTTRIATAGSCFAQHIAGRLRAADYTFYATETDADEDADGVTRGATFSARYGNIYTARQLLQLFRRAYGDFVPQDSAWIRPDGRYVDAFRPRVDARGFASAHEVAEVRERHLGAVRALFEGLDVLVFTLGLTESWRACGDGAVFPLPPGVVAGTMDADRYAFDNVDAGEVAADLTAFLAALRSVNPRAKLVLTVSPVPLAATYESRHVMVSTAYSKAALRVAAEQVARGRDDVWYFPAYEIVTGAFNRGAYFEADLRSVAPAGVDHVMRVFLRHCASVPARDPGLAAALEAEINAHADVLCDEDALAQFGLHAGPGRGHG